jgi:D-glycero-alpha-D-manno-heptose-7-phosphate kinase
MDELKQYAHEMKRALLKGNIVRLGELLDLAWCSKKRMAEGISNPEIDDLYSATCEAGALGGKISGVGGGGFMFFIADPMRKHDVQLQLREKGAQILPFSLVDEGLCTWRA